MAKDPAFLFYSSDFLTGVADLTMDERGQYITLLCLQHQKGRLTPKAVALATGNAAAYSTASTAGRAATPAAPDVLAKFEIDEEGRYYNPRLEAEAEKRAKHSQKQRERANKRWNKNKDQESHGNAAASAAVMPLENENGNEIENESIAEITRRVVSYLNEKAGTKYQDKTRTTRAAIAARVREGFTFEDFCEVIDRKVEQWTGGRLETYLRPLTLFGSKFEGYLNGPKPKAQKTKTQIDATEIR